jgi:hypothetical protein
MYFDPETIPEEYVQPWARAGVVRGQDELIPGSGLNAHHRTATSEGGPQNRVLTAAEEFLSNTQESIEMTLLPITYGVAVLAPHSRLDACEGLRTLLSDLSSEERLLSLRRQLSEAEPETNA